MASQHIALLLWSSMAPPKRSLVRDDLQYPLALLGAGLALYTSNSLPLWTCYLPGCFICELSWRMLRQPLSFYATYKIDATLWTYMASIAIWLSLAMMTCTFVLHALAETGIELSDGGSVAQHAMTALVVALGVGSQPILNNFTSGLLLVLFRPFRVGDDVQVGDELFTVQAITAFFVTGTTFQNLHVSLSNSTMLASSTPLTNYTANTSLNLELSVHVHAGQQPCAVVRAAMSAAAANFEAGLVAALEESQVADAHAVAAALPPPAVLGPCAITEHGVEWMLKPLVPKLAWLKCIHLGNQCIHDALMEADVAIFEASDVKAISSTSSATSSTMSSPPAPPPSQRRATSASRRRGAK
eukprot:SAG31_NODE_810_length_11919_cov_4.480924_12_plen_357_part_00